MNRIYLSKNKKKLTKYLIILFILLSFQFGCIKKLTKEEDIGITTEINYLNEKKKNAKFDKNNELVEACKAGRIELVKLLIEDGSDVNSRNINGETGLMWASRQDNLIIIR